MSRKPGAVARHAPAPEELCPLTEEERAQLVREPAARAAAEAAITRLRAMEQVSEVALSNLPLEDLLHELLRRIRRVLHGDAARLFLVTDDGQALRMHAFDGLGPETTEDSILPMGRGLAGRIAAHGQAMIVDDIHQVEVLSPTLRATMRSQIGAPLTVEGRVIGVVDVNSAEPQHFSGDDLHLLQLVADRAALAIQNARLYQQARFEQARWQATVESMLDPVAVVDDEGRIAYMNAAYQRLIGPAARLGLSVEERLAAYHLFHPDGRPFQPQELPLYRAVLSGEEVLNVETVQRTGTEARIAVWNAAPLRDDARIIGAVMVGRDVTQERKAEAERERLLAEVQARAAELDATINSVAEGLIIYSPTGEIVRMNPAAQTMLGYSPAQRERPIVERLQQLRIETPDGQPLPVDKSPPSRAVRGETVRGEVLVIHPPTGRAIWVYSSAGPIRCPNDRLLGSVVTFADITELHELQEQLEDVLRAISHDLRNPLAVVQGQAQLLLRALDKAGLTGAEHKSAESILTSARRMNSMIQDLVDAARQEVGVLALERRPVDLPATLLDLIERLAATLDTGRIRVVAPPDLPHVLADPGRLERILTNLLSNALKYSTPETEVTVTLRQRDGEVVTSVQDRGPGIPPDELPQLFQRYYRARAARTRPEGIGLGLYITRMLVEAHGGRIWAESEPDVGSTFSFSLPLAQP
jgi:PAS domain S-box-containing protein